MTGKIQECQFKICNLVEDQTTLRIKDVQGDEKTKLDLKRRNLEAQPMNIDKSEAAARRNNHFQGSVIPEIKDELKDECRDVELHHLQAGKTSHRQAKAFVKFGVDGAVITSHVVNEKSIYSP